MSNIVNPKVFISYCQESIEFSDKVLNFSNKLRQEGIDTILDQYEESPVEGWPRWMENSITNSDYVLVVCTEEYINRLMHRTENNIGKGVVWESNLIYQHLYNQRTLNNRFIPIVFKHSDTEFIPMPLQGSTYYNVSNKKRYDKLYWRLRGISTNKKPELGPLRPLPIKERKSLFICSVIDIESWDKAVWRGAGFIIDPSMDSIPIFMLPFKNELAARKIFRDWQSLYGKEDIYDEIRIAIIEGDIPGAKKGYSIHISSNIDRVIERISNNGLDISEDHLLHISRVHRANPTDNFAMYNLFKDHYNKHHKYYLMPAILKKDTIRVKPIENLGILKKELIFRSINDVDENDIDHVVFNHGKLYKDV